MAPDSGDDDASALRERVRELEQTVADLKTERQRPTVGRRGVLGALAGAAGLGAVGVYGSSQPAAAQAAGQVGTASDPVDVFGYNVQAENGVETPSLTDTDTGTTYDIGTFTEGEVLSDQDGDGVYTLPSGSVGIDVGSVTTGQANINHLSALLELTDQQSISQNTDATINWDSQDLDSNIFSYDSGASSIDVLVDGDYRVDIYYAVTDISSGDLFALKTALNGSITRTVFPTASGTDDYFAVSYLFKDLSANDSLRFDVRTDSSNGGAIIGSKKITKAGITREG